MPLQAVKPSSKNCMSSSSERAGQAQAVGTQAGLLGEEEGGGSRRLRAGGAGWRVREGCVEGAAPGTKVRVVTWRQEEDLTPLFRPPRASSVSSPPASSCAAWVPVSWAPSLCPSEKMATTHPVKVVALLTRILNALSLTSWPYQRPAAPWNCTPSPPRKSPAKVRAKAARFPLVVYLD